MTTRRLGWLVLGTVLCGLFVGAAARAEECGGAVTADEVIKAEDSRYAAQTANDFAAMERLFGDDLVYIHSSGVVDDKKSFIEVMRSGATRYRAIRRKDVKVRVYGCLAVLTGSADVDITSRGQDLTLQLRFLSAWAKRPTGLQFVSWNSTRIAPPPQ